MPSCPICANETDKGIKKMNGFLVVMIVLAVVCILLLAVFGCIFYMAMRAKRTVQTYSKAFFGTEDPIAGMKKAEMESANTPRSVASATKLYLPQIMKDFPEFHYDEMKERAGNVLVSYLMSIHENNAAMLSEGLDELKDSLHMYLEGLYGRGEREFFENIRIHRTEISQYRKTKGRCSVVFQSAVEYVHYVVKDGKIVRGRKDLKTQARYNVEVIYIQDRDTVENLENSGLGLNCPNCGAPLPGVGAKKCLYCDTPVVEFNIRTWNFSSVKEVL